MIKKLTSPNIIDEERAKDLTVMQIMQMATGESEEVIRSLPDYQNHWDRTATLYDKSSHEELAARSSYDATVCLENPKNEDVRTLLIWDYGCTQEHALPVVENLHNIIMHLRISYGVFDTNSYYINMNNESECVAYLIDLAHETLTKVENTPAFILEQYRSIRSLNKSQVADKE